ncbi:hypothetical protein E4T56_gene15719, partial [Termitomyces sp. T112]
MPHDLARGRPGKGLHIGRRPAQPQISGAFPDQFTRIFLRGIVKAQHAQLLARADKAMQQRFIRALADAGVNACGQALVKHLERAAGAGIERRTGLAQHRQARRGVTIAAAIVHAEQGLAA